MPSVRLKQSITFQETGEVVDAGVHVVGDSITKKQFEAIKDNPRFCEVMESSAPKQSKPAPKVEKDAD